jgi:DHA1 family multidrug resistance protein-like MFS transporter
MSGSPRDGGRHRLAGNIARARTRESRQRRDCAWQGGRGVVWLGLAMVIWKRNLLVIWVAQFCSLFGVGMGLPFAPFYIQTLGVTDPAAVKFWSALFFAAAALPMGIMGPIWGDLADHRGRKPMLLRASLCAGIVLSLMAFVPNVQALIALRFVQGMLSGTMTAAVTLVVTCTPSDRHGYAMGWLSSAQFGGQMMAACVGGLVAERFGYRVPFVLSGLLLLVGFVVVLRYAHEEFVPPAPVSRAAAGAERLALLRAAWPILAIIFAVGIVRQFDSAMFPLLVQSLLGGQLAGAAAVTGMAGAAAAVGSMLSGVCFGRLSDRYPAATIGRLTTLGASLSLLSIGLAQSLAWLAPGRLLMYFFAGGLDPMFQAWLARSTPSAQRGRVMGFAVTARCIGWMAAPLLSAGVATVWGITAVFLVGPALYLLLIPLIGWLSRRMAAAPPPETAAQGSASSAK